MPEILSRRGAARNIRVRRDSDGNRVMTRTTDAFGQEYPSGRTTAAIDRRCTVCRQWLPQTTENFWAHPTNGSVCARCRTCDREARARYSRPAPNAAGTSRSGRVFGVEMELTGPSSSYILTALREHGIRTAAGNQDGDAMSYGHTNTNGHVWTLKRDSSVSGRGLELVSPKLRGDAGFAELAEVCKVLGEVGATVDRSCGLHVHHDFRGLTLEQIKRQVLALVDAEAFVMQMVAPSRRGNSYCPRWEDWHREQVVNARDLSAIGSIGPRGAVNLWAYTDHGSVEVRAHAGTTNVKKITAWIRFGQAVFAAAEAGHDLPMPNGRQITADVLQAFLLELIPYGLQTEDVAQLMRFVTIGETRQVVEARVAYFAVMHETAESVLEEVAS